MISAARCHARIGRRLDVANIRHGTIGVLIASADAAIRIAEAAGANHISPARLPEFLRTHRIATVAGCLVAIVATFSDLDNGIATARWDTRVRIGHRRAKLSHRAIRVGVASAHHIRRIAEFARACRTHAHTCSPEFEKTNTIATITVCPIAVVATLRGTLLTVATNGAPLRSTRNGIRERGLQRAAPTAPERRSRAINADDRSIVRRAAGVIRGIGWVEPRHHQGRDLDGPIDEIIIVNVVVVAECSGHDLDNLGVAHGHRQWRRHDRNGRCIRGISRVVRRRGHRILIEIDGIRIVDSVENRRILVCRRIVIRIDDTTPTSGPDHCRVLTWIDIEAQSEIEMRGIRCNVQCWIRRVADDVASHGRVTFDVDDGLPAIASDHPARVWRRKRECGRGGANVITSGYAGHEPRNGKKSPSPVGTLGASSRLRRSAPQTPEAIP